jgi:prefoldin subunit 5
MEYVKVNGTSYVRDIKTMALVNQDASGLQEYMNKRRALAAQKDEINNIKSEIQSVKDDITEIKKLMMQLIEKGSNG